MADLLAKIVHNFSMLGFRAVASLWEDGSGRVTGLVHDIVISVPW